MLTAPFARPLNAWRARLGLPAAPPGGAFAVLRRLRLPVLYTCSPALLGPPPKDWVSASTPSTLVDYNRSAPNSRLDWLTEAHRRAGRRRDRGRDGRGRGRLPGGARTRLCARGRPCGLPRRRRDGGEAGTTRVRSAWPRRRLTSVLTVPPNPRSPSSRSGRGPGRSRGRLGSPPSPACCGRCGARGSPSSSAPASRPSSPTTTASGWSWGGSRTAGSCRKWPWPCTTGAPVRMAFTRQRLLALTRGGLLLQARSTPPAGRGAGRWFVRWNSTRCGDRCNDRPLQWDPFTDPTNPQPFWADLARARGVATVLDLTET